MEPVSIFYLSNLLSNTGCTSPDVHPETTELYKDQPIPPRIAPAIRAISAAAQNTYFPRG